MPKPKHRGGVWTGSTYEQQCVGQNGAGTCERNVHKQFWTRDEKFQVRKVGANKSENECREECVHGKHILAVRLWTKWRWSLQDRHMEAEAISVAHERNKGKWRETK
jgi:hypothetical protein